MIAKRNRIIGNVHTDICVITGSWSCLLLREFVFKIANRIIELNSTRFVLPLNESATERVIKNEKLKNPPL